MRFYDAYLWGANGTGSTYFPSKTSKYYFHILAFLEGLAILYIYNMLMFSCLILFLIEWECANRKLEIPTNREDFLCVHALLALPARAGCAHGALRVW